MMCKAGKYFALSERNLQCYAVFARVKIFAGRLFACL
jgi:hypothetical protein